MSSVLCIHDWNYQIWTTSHTQLLHAPMALCKFQKFYFFQQMSGFANINLSSLSNLPNTYGRGTLDTCLIHGTVDNSFGGQFTNIKRTFAKLLQGYFCVGCTTLSYVHFTLWPCPLFSIVLSYITPRVEYFRRFPETSFSVLLRHHSACIHRHDNWAPLGWGITFRFNTC